MAEEAPKESFIASLCKGDHSSSSTSSDSDTEDRNGVKDVFKTKVFRLFGRERPVHHVLGGGQPADFLLWRNKKISGGVVGIATLIWVLFEVMEYHLLTLTCHCLMLILSLLFIWSKISSFVGKSSGEHNFLEFDIPEDFVIKTAKALRNDINRGLCVLSDIASGREFKKLIGVMVGLWILSIIGSRFSFLTLFYIDFILLHTVPVLYEKYDDKVDALAEKGMLEIKRVYVGLEVKLSSKIPHGHLKSKKP